MKHFLGIVLLFIITSSMAQETWSVIFRPALHVPTRKVLDEPLRIGNGIEVAIAHSLGGHFKIYGGMIWNRFDTDDDFYEENIEFIQRGVVFGGTYFFYAGQQQKNPFYIRAGLTSMDVKSHSIDKRFDIDADWAIGTQLGMGMKISSFENLSILPELRYGAISNNYDDRDIRRHLTFRNISITGGLMYTF